MIPGSGEGADCEDADVPRPLGWKNVMKIREVPLEDRVQLVEDIRDDVAEEQGVPVISGERRRELDKRLEAYRISNEPGAPALEAIERIRAGL